MEKFKLLFILFIGIIIFSISCKKENEDTTVKAGIISKNAIYHEVLDTTEKSYHIDPFQNHEIKFDLGYSISFVSPDKYEKSYSIYTNDINYQIAITSDSISPIIINKSELIDENLKWAYKPILYLEHNNTFEVPAYYYSYWHGKHGYIGIRTFKGDKYHYGWINVSLIGQIKVYDYLIEN
jgi:hypothetical protein